MARSRHTPMQIAAPRRVAVTTTPVQGPNVPCHGVFVTPAPGATVPVCIGSSPAITPATGFPVTLAGAGGGGAVGYADLIRQDGAVAHWRLDELTGTLAFDSIGGAHGTISGGVTLGQVGAAGSGTAMTFNGSTGKITTATAVPLLAPYTLEAWLWMNAATYSAMVSTRTTFTQQAILFYVSDLRQLAFTRHLAGGSSPADVLGPVLPLNRWHHLVVVVTGANVAFFVNGAPDITGALAVTGSTIHPIEIGTASGTFLNGSLDEVAIYPLALTPAQIAAHYAKKAPAGYAPGSYAAKVIEDGASAYWKLDELSGTTAVDVIGGANGTISGGVTLAQPGALADGSTAMTFNGTATTGITVPNGPFLAVGTGPVSLEFWVLATVLSNGDWVLDFKSGGSAMPGMAVQFTGASVVSFIVADGTVITTLAATTPYADSRWHHVVGVVTRGAPDRALLYIDGVVQKDQALPTAGLSLTSATAAIIGNHQSKPAGGPVISLDEVAIYPVALTPAQIANHYTLGRTASSGSGVASQPLHLEVKNLNELYFVASAAVEAALLPYSHY